MRAAQPKNGTKVARRQHFSDFGRRACYRSPNRQVIHEISGHDAPPWRRLGWNRQGRQTCPKASRTPIAVSACPIRRCFRRAIRAPSPRFCRDARPIRKRRFWMCRNSLLVLESRGSASRMNARGWGLAVSRRSVRPMPLPTTRRRPCTAAIGRGRFMAVAMSRPAPGTMGCQSQRARGCLAQRRPSILPKPCRRLSPAGFAPCPR